MAAVSRPAHAALTTLRVVDDVLCLGGVPLPRLALRVGRTPFYAYDRDAIGARIRDLRASLPPDVSLHYAIKANPMPAVVQHVASLVDGLDVASAGELRVALDAGVEPGHVSFAGPGKSDAELEMAVASGILVNAESEPEVERLALVSDALGVPARVAVRVNPSFELKSSGMKMGGGAKAFGVDQERVPALLARIGELDLAYEGLHIFSGSQNLSAESIAESQAQTVELALALAEHAPGPLRTLNIGGGLGIPYFPGDRALDPARVGESLDALLEPLRERCPQTQVVMELGRYLVGEAGAYVCRVRDRKVSHGEIFLLTDGGLHHHLAASGNFGQVIRKNYPVVAAARVQGAPREVVTVSGPLCTPLDVLATRLEMGRAEPGDLIAVLQSGAYGLTASPTAFLGHPPPLEVLV